MDLELLEALALADDKTVALAQLLPGSEDHDYYSALEAQHRGALADAAALIEGWPARHRATARYERLRLRQLLLEGCVAEPTERAADRVRDLLGVSHSHEAEVEHVDPTAPPFGGAD